MYGPIVVVEYPLDLPFDFSAGLAAHIVLQVCHFRMNIAKIPSFSVDDMVGKIDNEFVTFSDYEVLFSKWKMFDQSTVDQDSGIFRLLGFQQVGILECLGCKKVEVIFSSAPVVPSP